MSYAEDSSVEEPISVETVLSEMKPEHLKMISNEMGIRYKVKRGEDEADVLLDTLCYETRKIGEKKILSSLPLKFLRDELIGDRISEDVLTSKGTKSKSIAVLSKRLFEFIHSDHHDGLESYIIDKHLFDREQQLKNIRIFLEFLEVDFNEEDSRKYLFRQLQEELDTFHLNNILVPCPPSFLRAVCETMYIKHWDCSSSYLLAEMIITGKHYDEVKPQEEVEEILPRSKKPKKISSRLTTVDLNYWFAAQELKEYCDSNNLKSTGKKTELSKRIVEFLDEDKENKEHLMKGYRKPKKAKGGRKKKASRTPGEGLREIGQNTMEMSADGMDIDSDDSF